MMQAAAAAIPWFKTVSVAVVESSRRMDNDIKCRHTRNVLCKRATNRQLLTAQSSAIMQPRENRSVGSSPTSPVAQARRLQSESCKHLFHPQREIIRGVNLDVLGITKRNLASGTLVESSPKRTVQEVDNSRSRRPRSKYNLGGLNRAESPCILKTISGIIIRAVGALTFVSGHAFPTGIMKV